MDMNLACPTESMPMLNLHWHEVINLTLNQETPDRDLKQGPITLARTARVQFLPSPTLETPYLLLCHEWFNKTSLPGQAACMYHYLTGLTYCFISGYGFKYTFQYGADLNCLKGYEKHDIEHTYFLPNV